MKRTITKIEVTEEEADAQPSTSTDGLLTVLVVVAIIIGLYSSIRRPPQLTIDQRGNTGTITNQWEVLP